MSNLGFNTGYIEELYAQFLEDPASVSEVWKEFFTGFTPSPTDSTAPSESDSKAPKTATISESEDPPASIEGGPAQAEELTAEEKPIRGAAARIVENMEASLGVPTATSVRDVPVKLMTENRRLLMHNRPDPGKERNSAL